MLVLCFKKVLKVESIAEEGTMQPTQSAFDSLIVSLSVASKCGRKLGLYNGGKM